MHWSNYSAKTVALIQAKGMPVDLPLWNLVQENKAAVIAALIRRFDPSQGSEDPIYAPDGSFSSRQIRAVADFGRHPLLASARFRRAAARQ